MATRTRFCLGLLFSGLLVGAAFFFNSASAQRADSAFRQTSQASFAGQTTTPLPDGRLLLLGGDGPTGITGAASIVDPRTGQSISLPTSLTIPRTDHSATVLPDGSVLVIGGRTKDGMAPIPEVFDPATQTFSTVAMSGGAFRSGHTATLLTDGRVLVAGGSAADGKPPASEVWELTAHTAAPLSGSIDRHGHTATLLGDGRVLIEGGRAADGQSLQTSSIVDPSTMTVVESRAPRPATENFVVAASSPASDARDVPLDARIGLRFSDALRLESATGQTIRLTGPDGELRTNVIVAEHGRLAFVWPLDPLVEEQTYTLSINGAVSDRGMAIVPATIAFTTVAGKPGSDSIDTEAWHPGTGKDGWRSGRGQSPWETLAPLQAADGLTAVSGRVLRLDGRPLPDVTLEMEGHRAQTDRTGRFLLRIEGLPTAEHTLEIDARTANKPGRTYGFYEARIIVRAGRTNVLPFTIWSPLIDTAHQVTIASPTLRETLVTTPAIPGLELHLPAGTVIRDEEGQVARTISITPVPLDRTPFPLPDDATFSMFFTIQPGGAYLHTPGPIKGGWLVYPRIGKSPVGKRVRFFDYDPDDQGWHSYGMGTVTATQVVPDAKTRIYAFNGASFNDGTEPPPPGPPRGDSCSNCGDPVNLTTGIFTYEMTDLVVNDVMPLSLTRTYRSQDTDPTSPRAFGIGMTMDYSIFLHSEVNMQEADLILPDGGRVHYVKTPESGANWWETIFEHTTSPTGFYKSRIAFWGNHSVYPGGWELKQKDGTVYVFGHQAPLQAIRDRNGNEIRLTWSGQSTFGSGKDNILRVTSPNGRWIAFTYYPGTGLVQTASDNIGRTVNYTYDGSGRLWKVTDPLNYVTEYTYDDGNRMIKIKNRNGVEYVANEYTTAADAPTPVGWVKKQTHADGGVYEFTYDVVNGKSMETTVTDPMRHRRRVTFNPAGYSLVDVRAEGEPEETTTTSDRPSGSNFVETATDAALHLTTTEYDTMGNATRITRLADTVNPAITTLTYDPVFNQVTSITDPLLHTRSFGYDAKGRLTSVTDALDHTTTFGYNAGGQVILITDPLQHTTQLTYSNGELSTTVDALGRVSQRFTNAVGQVVAETDPMGAMTRYEYDAGGHLTKTTDALGGVTQYGYNADGLLQGVTDARSHVTSYTYDAMNHLATRVDPVLHSDVFQTDLVGNLQQRVDRRGHVTRRIYDALNRLHQIEFGDGTTITYAYDAKSRITQISDSAFGTITRSYDDLDRLTSETTPQGDVSYTYDASDRRETMTVGGQLTLSYTYDDADRLTGVEQGTAAVTIAYDDADRRTSLALPSGLITEYGYDASNQLTSLEYRLGQTLLGNLAYSYDANGNVQQVSGSFARTGLPQSVSVATYDNANRLTQWAGQTLVYDIAGNVVSDGLSSFAWNARNQLASVAGAQAATFQYDGSGRRASKTQAGMRRSFSTITPMSFRSSRKECLRLGYLGIFRLTSCGVEQTHLVAG
jgi:YD repeat-containing protein